MTRNRNTDVSGKPFNDTTVSAVWQKGLVIPNHPQNIWRYDICRYPIKFDQYGNTNSRHGWEIDHITPVVKGGTDDLNDLQPLQWEENRDKGDTYPWTCL